MASQECTRCAVLNVMVVSNVPLTASPLTVGVFFEDPSLQAVRGFLTYAELEERWHDVGPKKEHIEHYGLVLWKPGARVSAYASRAERIA